MNTTTGDRLPAGTSAGANDQLEFGIQAQAADRADIAMGTGRGDRLTLDNLDLADENIAFGHTVPRRMPSQAQARGVVELGGLLLVGLLLLALLLHVTPAHAESALLPALTATPGAGGAQTYSLSVQTLLFFSALSFLPALLLMTTAFTRIVIVLGLLRHALGLQTSPPNQVIIGLSLFLTFFVMGPTLDKVYTEAWQPFQANQIGFEEALNRGSVPLKGFMMKQTRQADLALFVKISHEAAPVDANAVPMRLLVPAFVTSELKTAFQIGFAIFIPFLIIDLVTASVLMSMGMMMVSPSIISMPIKLMLFVLVDGWQLLIGSLAASFVT